VCFSGLFFARCTFASPPPKVMCYLAPPWMFLPVRRPNIQVFCLPYFPGASWQPPLGRLWPGWSLQPQRKVSPIFMWCKFCLLSPFRIFSAPLPSPLPVGSLSRWRLSPSPNGNSLVQGVAPLCRYFEFFVRDFCLPSLDPRCDPLRRQNGVKFVGAGV